MSRDHLEAELVNLSITTRDEFHRHKKMIAELQSQFRTTAGGLAVPHGNVMPLSAGYATKAQIRDVEGHVAVMFEGMAKLADALEKQAAIIEGIANDLSDTMVLVSVHEDHLTEYTQ